MNLIIRRSKQEHTNVWWENFATSTPLKSVPENLKTKFENELQKQLLANNDSVNIEGLPFKGFGASSIFQSRSTESKHLPPKKVRKSKSFVYFDLSSSSEDDSSENKKRPIIKLSSKKNTKRLLIDKKPKNGETEVANKVNIKQKDDSFRKINNIRFNSRKKSSVIDLKLKNGSSHNVKNKTKNTCENLKTDFKNICLSDEHGRTFDESKCYKNSVKGTKPSLINKENINYSKSDEKCKNFNNNGIKKEETGLKEVPKILVQPLCKYNCRSQTQKSLVKVATQNNKETKLLRKGINNTNGGGEPLKKTSTTEASVKPAKQSLSLSNTIAPKENKTNLSHQLFSEGREQEFINTLDLTSEEINYSIGDVKCSLWQNQNLPYKQSHPSNPNKDASKNNENTQDRPKRRRQEPKQFWMLQGTSDTTLNNTSKQTRHKRNTKISTKSDAQISRLYSVTKAREEDTVAKELKENSHKSNKVAERVSERALRAGRKRKIANLNEKNICAPDEALSVCFIEEKLKKTEANCVFSCLDSQLDIAKEAEPNKAGLREAASEKKTDETVFKQLHELSFNGNKMGCFTAQCWNINNFKCGVFKLKAGSQLSCRTLHRNSHLGGVLLKGTLKMKIRDKERDLREGDLAFVPPLTDWQATNIGDCESVFYYWCGRFK